jgi:hypothetical protein
MQFESDREIRRRHAGDGALLDDARRLAAFAHLGMNGDVIAV